MHIALVGAELEENLATRSLQSALEAQGHRVTQVAFDGPQGLEPAAAFLAGCGAELAGFSMVFTRRAREFASLLTRCRQLGFRGITVAGGHFAAFHPEQLLQAVPALDLVAVGEGESIMCALASNPASPAAIPGLVFRNGASLVRNPPATPEQDLDQLPWPAHRRPFDRYLGLPIVNLLGSRGCTYACAFCSIAAWHKLCGGQRYRVRSARSVAAEMACLWREGVRVFNFHDDNFLGSNVQENLARARALREELRLQGAGKLAFAIKARPDAVAPELFALLRSMGLFRVFLGIEAGTDTSLRHLGRGQTVADNERALRVLRDLDLHVAFNLLVLNPQSTLDDLAGNIAFMRAHAGHPLNFCRTEVYAGTPLERRLRAQGRLRGDFWGLDYVIDDARAQQAFALAMAAFWDRNFGAHPLHYLAGQVDYEHQLRMDFFGTTPELREAAKAFVRKVNLNTASYLEQTVSAVREGPASAGYAQELIRRVAEDDRRLAAEAAGVLGRLRELPPQKKRSAPAHAVVAASIALSLAACAKEPTHMMEMAPPPPRDYPVPEPEDADIGAHVMEAAPPPPAPPAPELQLAAEPDAATPDARAAGKDAGGGAKDASVDAKDASAESGAPDKPPPDIRTHMREAAPPPPWWPEGH
jgi:hypothetical protein